MNSKTLRYDARSALGKLMYEWAQEHGNAVTPSCASCQFAKRDGPFQCEKFNAVPPMSVIMVGCAEYADVDEIPF